MFTLYTTVREGLSVLLRFDHGMWFLLLASITAEIELAMAG